MWTHVFFRNGPLSGKMARVELPIIKADMKFQIAGHTYQFNDGPALRLCIKTGEGNPNLSASATFVEEKNS